MPVPEGTDEAEISERSKSRMDAALNEGQRMKQMVYDPDFMEDHRRKADGWIHATTPHDVVLPRNKRAGWLVRRNDEREKQRVRAAAIRQMPTLPFDLWCRMKQEEVHAAETQQEYSTQESRQHYMRLGAERKAELYGGAKRAGRRGSRTRSISPTKPRISVRASLAEAPESTKRNTVSVPVARASLAHKSE